MIEKINEDIKTALKGQEKFQLSVLRMLKNSIQQEQINNKEELNEKDILNIINKQVKQRNDSMKEFEKYNQTEKVDSLKEEIKILSLYLPEEANDELLVKTLDEAFEEINPQSMKDMSQIINFVSAKLNEYTVDMSKVSKMVKERLI